MWSLFGMSLKYFHLVFVGLAALLCFGCGWLAFWISNRDQLPWLGWVGMASIGLGIALLWYAKKFWNRLRQIDASHSDEAEA